MKTLTRTSLIAMTCLGILSAGGNGSAYGQDQGDKTKMLHPKPPPVPRTPPVVRGCVESGAKPDSYVLSNAVTEGGTDKSNYDIKGDARRLKDHVGHKVEITGQVTKPSSGRPVIALKSVKMISSSCE